MTVKADRFTYCVIWSEEDKEHIGRCSEFRSLSWLAYTPEEALAGVRKLVRRSVQDMKSAGEPVPSPGAVDRLQAAIFESLRSSIAFPKGVTAKSLIREGRR